MDILWFARRRAVEAVTRPYIDTCRNIGGRHGGAELVCEVMVLAEARAKDAKLPHPGL